MLRASRSLRLAAVLTLTGASLFSGPAHALFSDDEARQAVIDLRREARERADQQTQQITEATSRSQRAQLELAGQIEALRQEVARLRGQLELATKEVADTQRRQKDLYLDIDTRLKKLEPQAATIDGQQAFVDPNEKRVYDAAIDLFRNGAYADAVPALSGFLRQYPQSAFAPVAQFYIGSSQYALKDYKAAIAQQQALVRQWPQNVRAPDALLVMAASQVELNDKKSARATLERIVNEYGQAPAAQTARERLELLR
ncbi:tol-pal system protein YbgF [Pigmentiphaga aceris]|uniref:Cell division coordinator CpoB n=1 Tax=Pigmentiphaga aceris TaxID=1940612 RepID=A0A5C0B2I9_9BURK|nr:tol-pal system protein YbgF [Pigmentiphaga aceris]QEI08144.1 tol-pal system protein YbgF [Pigmentiphaga aceris]